jgi:Spy/CpxP family protein refolding chaperone
MNLKGVVDVRWLIVAGVMLAPGVVAAQPLGIPHGRWWERPKVAQDLALSQDQVANLNSLTLNHARTMVDLKALVEKTEIDLRASAELEPFDAKAVRQNFAALQQARMKLESQRFEMLLKVREVLTGDQWRRLRDLVRERREREKVEGLGGDGVHKPLRKWRN